MATVKHIRSDQPYLATTFNNKDYVLWGYPVPEMGGLLSGMAISYAAGQYNVTPGSFICIGDHTNGSNSGIAVEQDAPVTIAASSDGASAGQHIVMYGYVSTVAGVGGIEYGVRVEGDGSIPSGAAIIARGTKNASGYVDSWSMEPVVSVAGHVYSPSGAHKAHAIWYDNTYKQLPGDPDNVQDAIDALPAKLATPSEIEWMSLSNIANHPVTMNIPFDPTPTVVTTIPGWTPSMNNTAAVLIESYIPGGLTTEFVRVAGQFSARPQTTPTSGYFKYGIAVELFDDATNARGVYAYTDTPPLYGTDDNTLVTCPFDFLMNFGGSADARPVSDTINSYRYLTAPTPWILLPFGTSLPTSLQSGTIVTETERLYWRNPATYEWTRLTRNKDYSIDYVTGRVTFENQIAGYIYYSYKRYALDIYGLPHDVRADNGLHMFIYLFLYSDASSLTGTYGTQPVYNPDWWQGGNFVRQPASSIGVPIAQLVKNLSLTVTLR